ncbi:hypothetical protein Tco_1168668 [Tanacetum coccineum]
MSNTNNNLQTQTSNALHNAIMEAGGKDRPPMLAPDNSTGIDNDIYSTVDACPNACEMWKLIERLKQGESINVQYLETNFNREFGKFTSRDGESLESYYSRGTGYYNHTVVNIAMARENVAYHKEKMLLCKQEEAGFQLNAEQADWRDDTDDEPEDQELEAYYLEHQEQPEFVSDTYPVEQDQHNMIIDSLDMSYDREQVDQDDVDLAKEHDLLSSLIEKLKCDINDSKNCNIFLET